jgi:hypothetical protein
VAAGSVNCTTWLQKEEKEKPRIKITTTKNKKLKINITAAENWVCDINQKIWFCSGFRKEIGF